MNPDRTGWLAWRREGIGASEVARAAGLVVYGRDRFDLWTEKTTGVLVDETDRMRWGHLLEPLIAQEFTAETGLFVVGEQTQCAHPTSRHHRATVDGFVSETPASGAVGENLGIGDGILGVFEAKTGQWRWDDLPDHVTLQVQWQLHVTGMPRAWVAYLRAGHDFTIHEVTRDDDLIATLIERVDDFWTHVIDHTPPEPTAWSNVAAAYPTSTADTIELTGEAVSWYDRAIVLNGLVKQHTDQLEDAKHHLQVAMGEHATATVDGRPVATWKTGYRTTIDAKALEADLPEIAEKYRKTSEFRTFRLKDTT